jgi:FkbM family methyltransferase
MIAQKDYTNYYRQIHNDYEIPLQNENYLKGIKNIYNFEPTVIYDIGSAVLHWTKYAKKIYNNATIIAFDAVREVGEFYEEYGIDYHLDVLGDVDYKDIIFYEHPIYLGGNSYYKENSEYSKIADSIYDEEHTVIRKMRTIDSIVNERNFPLPDMIKIDVQGCELDILKGMTKTLKNVQHILVELQMVEYNIGAKTIKDSIPFIESLGFKLQPVNLINEGDLNLYYCGNGPDADFHFKKV